jgi:hypothetical protein
MRAAPHPAEKLTSIASAREGRGGCRPLRMRRTARPIRKPTIISRIPGGVGDTHPASGSGAARRQASATDAIGCTRPVSFARPRCHSEAGAGCAEHSVRNVSPASCHSEGARAAPSPATAPSSDRGIFSTGQVICSPARNPALQMYFHSAPVDAGHRPSNQKVGYRGRWGAPAEETFLDASRRGAVHHARTCRRGWLEFLRSASRRGAPSIKSKSRLSRAMGCSCRGDFLRRRAPARSIP